MTRLVNAMREGIVKRLMAHTFDERKETLRTTHAALALDVYRAAFMKNHKQIEELPHGWLPMDDRIIVRSGSSEVSLHFDGNESRYTNVQVHVRDVQPKTMRFPDNCKGTVCGVYDTSHPLSVRIEKWQQQRAALIDEINAAQRRASVTLDRFTTVEKLIEDWPEIAPFVSEADKPAACTAVAIPRPDLNAMFKLPVAQ